MRRTALLLILPLFSLHALAATLKFPEHNFSVEIPRGWVAMVPPPKDSLLAIQSPTKTEQFLVFATKNSPKQHPDAAKEVRDGDRKMREKEGDTVDPDEEAVINGVKFVTFAAHLPKGGILTEYTANSGDQVYLLQAAATNADGVKSPELQAAVQSFDLLGPAGMGMTPAAPAPSSHDYYRLILSTLIVVALVLFVRRFLPRRGKP